MEFQESHGLSLMSWVSSTGGAHPRLPRVLTSDHKARHYGSWWVGFRRGSDRSTDAGRFCYRWVFSRHPESEIEISAGAIIVDYAHKLPAQRQTLNSSQLRSLVPFGRSARRSADSGFFHAHCSKSISPDRRCSISKPMKNQSAPHVMTAQIPGPASEWVISATQPFLLDPDRSSVSLHYLSTKRGIPWFLFASNSNWSGRQR
jgi:hypothetical protein